MNFILKDDSNVYKLPQINDCFDQTIWSFDSLKQIKFELNAVKSGLNDIDLNVWSKHTAITDKSSMVMACLKRQLTHKPFLLTKAWIKIYEIISKFQLIDNLITNRMSGQRRQLCALLLCECPGSFINSINHYIKSNSLDIRLEWMANTLNPYYEDIDYTIIDDKFIRTIGLFDNWFFGSTNTGNILDNSFVSDLKQEMNNRRIEKFSLITCDGSINCVDCPQTQEEVVQPLISKEIVVSLEVLSDGGCLVVKCFTLFECQTLCLLYLLCCAFKQIHVFKPNMSKAGNSEIYLICIGFESSLGLNSILSLISKNNESKVLFSRQSVPQNFLTKVEECLKFFIKNQILIIKNNLELFKSMDEQKRQQIIKNNTNFAKNFIKSLKIFSISPFEELIHRYDQNSTNCLRFKNLNLLLTNNQSYNNRLKNNFFSNQWFESLDKQLVQTISDKMSLKMQLIECKYWKQNSNTKLFDIKLIYGLPYNQIRNSKFCDLSLIICYNNCMKYKEKFKIIGNNFVSFSSETQEIIRHLFLNIKNEIIFDKFVINSDKSCDNFIKQLSTLFGVKSIEIISNLTQEVLALDPKRPVIFVINAFNEFNLDLIKEKVVLNELISQFCRFSQLINENDLLIIQIGLSLTRLMSAILYMISKLFQFYSLVPCLTSDEHNRHGLILLFHSRHQDFRLINQLIEQKFNQMLDSLNNNKESQTLVEIISVPQLISDSKFYETLFNGNCIQTINLLKIMSHLIIK